MEQPERAQSHAARLPAATKLRGGSCACPERRHSEERAGGAGQRETGRHGSQRDVRSPTPEQLLCPRASARARLCGSASHQRVIETRAPSPVRATPSPAPLQERLAAPGLPGCARAGERQPAAKLRGPPLRLGRERAFHPVQCCLGQTLACAQLRRWATRQGPPPTSQSAQRRVRAEQRARACRGGRLGGMARSCWPFTASENRCVAAGCRPLEP